eukprot:8732781-Pyramimonas_sp.AAC.1
MKRCFPGRSWPEQGRSCSANPPGWKWSPHSGRARSCDPPQPLAPTFEATQWSSARGRSPNPVLAAA